MEGKNLKGIFENTAWLQQRTDGRKFYHLGVMGVKPTTCVTAVKQEGVQQKKGKGDLKQYFKRDGTIWGK